MQIALKGMARRSFLIALGVALLKLFTFRLRAFWRPFIITPGKGEWLPSRPNPFGEGDKISVAVVHGRDIEKIVREALDLIGGIERLDVLGKTYLDVRRKDEGLGKRSRWVFFSSLLISMEDLPLKLDFISG